MTVNSITQQACNNINWKDPKNYDFFWEQWNTLEKVEGFLIKTPNWKHCIVSINCEAQMAIPLAFIGIWVNRLQYEYRHSFPKTYTQDVFVLMVKYGLQIQDCLLLSTKQAWGNHSASSIGTKHILGEYLISRLSSSLLSNFLETLVYYQPKTVKLFFQNFAIGSFNPYYAVKHIKAKDYVFSLLEKNALNNIWDTPLHHNNLRNSLPLLEEVRPNIL